jgi:hypothetical protein
LQEIVVTLLLAAHLLAMNVASAGPLVGTWLLWRVDRDAGTGAGSSSRILWLSLRLLIVGSLLGGCLLLLPNASLRAALGRFPAEAYWFAGLELIFSAGCILALIIGGAWFAERRRLAAVIALLSATNLLYHFPPLMAVLGELAADPRWAADEQIDRAALLRLWARPEILALWAHFVLASLAVAPIAALWPSPRRDSEARLNDSPAIVRRLGAWALAATLLQIPVGLWLLAASDAAARDSMLGENLWASACFAGGVLAALWLLQTLTAIVLGDKRSAVRRAGLLLVLVTTLMSATLRASRAPSIEKAPRDHATAPSPSTSQTPLASVGVEA